MQQSGEHRIGAPIAEVWRALNDLDVLQQCIEGCQSMVRLGDDAFEARIKAVIGPVSAVFIAEIKQTELQPPHACTLVGQVKGGAAGFGKGQASIDLAEEQGVTVLRYEVEGSVGGKLAQVGQRLINGVARKMADRFFARFSEIVAPAAEVAAAPPSAPAPRKSRAAIFIAAAAAVAVILVYLLLKR
jgi:carbon monoxide dehydrogenase subunit G